MVDAERGLHRVAVAGKVLSGVAVASTIRSIVCGVEPGIGQRLARRASPGGGRLALAGDMACRMPVRSTIHSSVVSIYPVSSWLVISFLGRAEPQPLNTDRIISRSSAIVPLCRFRANASRSHSARSGG